MTFQSAYTAAPLPVGGPRYLLLAGFGDEGTLISSTRDPQARLYSLRLKAGECHQAEVVGPFRGVTDFERRLSRALCPAEPEIVRAFSLPYERVRRALDAILHPVPLAAPSAETACQVASRAPIPPAPAVRRGRNRMAIGSPIAVRFNAEDKRDLGIMAAERDITIQEVIEQGIHDMLARRKALATGRLV